MKLTLTEEEIEKLKVNKGVRPHRVKFQITNSCNCRCKHCNLYLIKPDVLKTEVILRTLNELAKLDCREVDFTGGEPTLHKDLVKFIELATNLGMKVKMNSNGYLINEKLAESLVKAGLKEFAISIDSHNPDDHNIRRNLKDSWQKAIAAIQNIDKYRKKYKTQTEIVLYSIITNKNYLDTTKVLDLKKIANFDEINFIPIKNIENKDDFLLKKQIDEFYKIVKPKLLKKYEKYHLKGIFRTVDDPFEIISSNLKANSTTGLYTKEIYKNNPCFITNFYAYIISDGTVVPCCVAPHHLKPEYLMGNINTDTFYNIWNSDKYNSLRKTLLKPCFSICDCCSGHHTDFNRDIYKQIKDYEKRSKKD